LRCRFCLIDGVRRNGIAVFEALRRHGSGGQVVLASIPNCE
jgi:hypothetical protein